MRLTVAALAVVAAHVAAPVFAQQATLTSPDSITKAVVNDIHISRETASATVIVEFQNASSEARRVRVYRTASSAELVSFLTAIGTARSGETGIVPRRFNFRVLGWLVDNAKLVDDSGNEISVTLVP